MKKIVFICAAALCAGFTGCSPEKGDREKSVEVTIYPETTLATPFMSEMMIDALMF